MRTLGTHAAYPDKIGEVFTILWRASAIGWVLPVKVKAIKASLSEEGDTVGDEVTAVAR